MESGKRFKIACVGAGNVGASAAQYCAEMELGDVILTDIVEGVPQGKALDLTQAGPIRGYGSMVTGTNDYKDIAGADVCIVSAGLPRKPGSWTDRGSGRARHASPPARAPRTRDPGNRALASGSAGKPG